MKVKIDLLRLGAKVPTKKFDYDAGLDIYAPEDGVLYPGMNTIGTGLAIHIPAGNSGYIFPRSGLATQGVIPVHPCIDCGYTGEVYFIVLYVGKEPFKYEKGTRLGQLVIFPTLMAEPTTWDVVTREERGFGSSGVKEVL